MSKKISTIVLIALFAAQLIASPGTVDAAPIVPITAPSAILIDNSTQTVYYSKTPHLRRAPASTTKILTAIVVLDQMGADEVITIPAFVKSIEPSKIYLKQGEKYRVRELVKAMLVNSANDAAETLGWAAGGGRAGFSKLMNAKVRSLGCQDSNFVNPSGLPDARQYSTVYDMSLIVRASQKYPLIVEAMKIRTGSIRSLGGRKLYLRNHNKMLWRTRNVMGKTGWTRAARHCFVGYISAYNKKVYVAMLGSHRLWRDLKTLVDFQFGLSFRGRKANKDNSDALEPRQIQLALKRAGYYSGPVTGHIGPVTRKAIKRFQKAHKIPQTGTVGPLTTDKLNNF